MGKDEATPHDHEKLVWIHGSGVRDNIGVNRESCHGDEFHGF